MSTFTTTKFQNCVQYRRFLPLPTEEIFDLVGLAAHHTFYNIWSGIGLVAIQAATTRGCEVHGLKLMEGRMRIAEELQQGLRASIRSINATVDVEDLQQQVNLRHGDLTNLTNLDFLTLVEVVFVKNYEYIFVTQSRVWTKAANLTSTWLLSSARC